MKKVLQWHRYADLFPLIEGQAFEDLKADVAKFGVIEPIVLLDGLILDGRNRHRAASEAGVECPTVDYSGADPLGFVLSKNLTRRHLDEGQRAMVAAKLANMPAHRPADKSANLQTSVAAAAKMLNVGERSVASARTVQEKASPELQSAVERGEVAVSAAAVVANSLSKEAQTELAKSGAGAVKQAAKSIKNAKNKPIEPKRKIHQGLTDAERIEELEAIVEDLTAEKAGLEAKVASLEPMRLEYERGGFAEVIKNLGEQIRVLKTRVETESQEKVKNLRSAEYWKREAVKLGWSRNTVIDLDTLEEVKNA